MTKYSLSWFARCVGSMCACVAAPPTAWCAGSLVQQPQSKLRVSVIFKGAQGAQAPGSCMAPRPTPPTLCAPPCPLGRCWEGGCMACRGAVALNMCSIGCHVMVPPPAPLTGCTCAIARECGCQPLQKCLHHTVHICRATNSCCRISTASSQTKLSSFCEPNPLPAPVPTHGTGALWHGMHMHACMGQPTEMCGCPQ